MTSIKTLTDEELAKVVWLELPDIAEPHRSLVEELLDRFHAFHAFLDQPKRDDDA